MDQARLEGVRGKLKSPSLCKEELKDIENQPDYARVFTFLASLLFRLAALFL
jgi:hypothetical protein